MFRKNWQFTSKEKLISKIINKHSNFDSECEDLLLGSILLETQPNAQKKRKINYWAWRTLKS